MLHSLSGFSLHRDSNVNSRNRNLANSNDNGRMAQSARSYINVEIDNLYPEIYSMKNLVLAWKKARKGKTKKDYVIEFEKNLRDNLKLLHYELKFQYYKPRPLATSY